MNIKRPEHRTGHGQGRNRLCVPALILSMIVGCGSSAGNDASAVVDVDAGADVDASTEAGGSNPGIINDTPDASVDTGTCEKLNIGILGTSGKNASSNFQAWLVAAGTSVQRIQTGEKDVLTAADLASFDVVILDKLMHNYTPAETSVFTSWVKAGGGVVSLTGYTDSPSIDFRANALLAPLSVGYTGGLVNGPVKQFVSHPITQGLTSVTFAGGYLVKDLGGVETTRTAIASIPAGNVAYAVVADQGHAFVWGDEWIEFDSEWKTQPEIEQLWTQIFEWVARKSHCKLSPPR